MAKHKVEITGINTANLKVLTSDEQLELFKKMQNGDKFAREDLIKGNLKLVLSILRNFNNKIDNMDDLFQVGCIGLVKAIDNFDLKYNVKLDSKGNITGFEVGNDNYCISRKYNNLVELTVDKIKDGKCESVPEIVHSFESDDGKIWKKYYSYRKHFNTK